MQILESTYSHLVTESSTHQLNYIVKLHAQFLRSLLIKRMSRIVLSSSSSKDKFTMESEYENGIIVKSHDVLVASGDQRRQNNGEKPPPGEHSSNSRKRKRSREEEEDEDEEEEEEEEEYVDSDEDLIVDRNGYEYKHSDKAYLIVNLYSSGYTFTAYLPMEGGEDARTFEESHLIPYSETYLLSCIDSETVPHRLITKLKNDFGIVLDRYRSCVKCDVRDFRRFPSTSLKKSPPICRQVVLKPTNFTLLSDLEHLIHSSKILKKSQKNNEKDSNPTLSERLKDPDFPFDRSKTDGSYLGLKGIKRGDEEELSLEERHEVEKKIVKETANSLCLDPSKQVGLIANRAQMERFKWNSKELKKTVESSVARRAKLKSLKMQGYLDEDEGVVESDSLRVVNIRKPLHPVFNFIKLHKIKGKKKMSSSGRKSGRGEDFYKLPQIRYLEYSSDSGPIPSNLRESIESISAPALPSSIRPLYSENFVKRTEQYLFHTERRGIPHRTRLAIFQRNNLDSYYGELEQEGLGDKNSNNEPRSSSSSNNSSSTNSSEPFPSLQDSSSCVFELGSYHHVVLYIKQFTDILTEDGQKPCKITYQGNGYPVQSISTNAYKEQERPKLILPTTPTNSINNNNNNNSNAIGTPISQASSNSSSSNAASIAPSYGGGGGSVNNVIISHNGAPPPPHNSSNTIVVSIPNLPSLSQAPTTPLQPSLVQTPVSTPGVMTQKSVQIVHPQPRTVPLHSNSSPPTPGLSVPTSQNNTAQANLSLNLHLNSGRLVQQTGARQQVLTRPKTINVNLSGRGAGSGAPQLIQTNNIRVRQPGLATLLLGTGAKPITVAIQPQPQNLLNLNQVQAIQLNSSSGEQLQAVSSSGSPFMIIATSNGVQQVATHSGLSLNLNTINLEGLLNGTPYITGGGGGGRGGSGGGGNQPTLNFFRLAANGTGNSITLSQQPGRQSTLSGLLSPQQVIINNSPSSNRGLRASSGGVGVNSSGAPELDELSVPDLNTLLSSPPPPYSSNGSTSIDLNLNLNLNLSGGSGHPPPPPPPPSHLHHQLHHLHSGSGPPPLHHSQSAPVENAHHSVDVSLLNALSEAIGPGEIGDGGQGSEAIGGLSALGSPSKGSSPFKLHPDDTGPSKSFKPSQPPPPTLLTLTDLLGSPPMISPSPSPSHHTPPHLTPPPHSTSSPSSFNTPRLSALLAGSPSADCRDGGSGGASGRSFGILPPSPAQNPGSRPNYSNLLDRLLSSSPGSNKSGGGGGGSRLHPIATATPSVVLENPMLAATLASGTSGGSGANLRQALLRPTAYRQIAPAPAPGGGHSGAQGGASALQQGGQTPQNKSTIQASQLQQQQQHQQQQQQLINLLGFVNGGGGNVGGGGGGGGGGSQCVAQALSPSGIRLGSSTGGASSSATSSGNMGSR